MSKLYKKEEIIEILHKSLHKAIAKAAPELKAILADLEDPNHEAEVPEDLVPHGKAKPVLYKKKKKPGEKLGAKMDKKEYTPEEVACMVLKKAESMLKPKIVEWDQKVHKIDGVNEELDKNREVANMNDVAQAINQDHTNTSAKRLKEWVDKQKKRKAKKAGEKDGKK